MPGTWHCRRLCRVAEAERRRGRPRTCLSKQDKGLFHDYRERLKLLRACVTSQEVVQHMAAIPSGAITSFLWLISLSFISSAHTCHVLSLPHISCDCQPIIPEESVAFPVLSLCSQCYYLLFFVSPPSVYKGFMHQCPEVLSQAFSTL